MSKKNEMVTDPILTPSNDRLVLFPIKYDSIWEMYKLHMASFWTAEEIDLSQDISDFNNKLNDNERFFIKNVLAFFASSDAVVNENLVLNFLKEVQIPEARCFYGFQLMMENIHSETYSLLIDTYVQDAEEKSKLFHAIDTIPAVKKKAEWALKWIDNAPSFAHRLIAFAAVEGIFFSGSFCAIYWLKKRGLMPGLSFSNELISKDETLHTDFACLLHSLLQKQTKKTDIESIISEAVEIECEFIKESIPVSLIGMNADMMQQYIKFVSDRLLVSLGCERIYKVDNPFDWMDLISLQGKTNFFEKRVSDYNKAGIVGDSNRVFSYDEDF
jgi:ribonucleoside-diphosphate reductase beta chain